MGYKQSSQLIKGKIEIASPCMGLSVFPAMHKMQIRGTISPSARLPNGKNNNLLFIFVGKSHIITQIQKKKLAPKVIYSNLQKLL